MSAVITGTTTAWLTEYSSADPRALGNASPTDFVFSDMDMSGSGWTKVGEATITVRLTVDQDQMIAAKVAALRAQVSDIRADAEDRARRLEDRIQKLLAITYTPEAA